MKVSKASKKIKFPQLRGSLAGMKYPAIAEIKVDGEFNYAGISHNHSFVINKYGTVKSDFTMLNEITEKLRKVDGFVSAMFACEVYWGDGKLGALYDFLSNKTSDDLHISLFDTVNYNDEKVASHDLLDRKEIIQEAGLNQYTPKCWVVNNENEVTKIFEEAVNLGYEGLVVKSFDTAFVEGPCTWTKIKFKDRSQYMVCLVDSNKERIEITAPSFTDPSGIVKVGVKASDKYKKHLKPGDIVTVEHQGVLKSGSLRHPVLIPEKGWK